MQPPRSRRQRDRSVSFLVEASADRRSALHAFLQKIFKTLTRTWLGKKLVTHGDNIDWIKIHRYVQSRTTVVRLAQNDLHSGARYVVLRRRIDGKLAIDEPSGAAEHENQTRAQNEDNGHAKHSEKLADRKSTRLNSSHSQISYAVFCLKKKKKKNKKNIHNQFQKLCTYTTIRRNVACYSLLPIEMLILYTLFITSLNIYQHSVSTTLQ